MTLALDSAFGSVLLDNTGAILAYALVGLVLFVIGFYVVDLATPGRLISVIRHEKNPNASLLASAAMISVGIIVAASIYASDADLLEGLIATGVYGLIGIVAQTVAMLVFNLLIGLKIKDICQEEHLEPATWMLAVTYVMIGFVTAFAVI
ncbi:MAG: DUF350 domain-containing protein [Streptosporangiaceae bacterium]